MKRTVYLLAGAAVVLAVAIEVTAAPRKSFPYVGVVKATRLNVRAGAGTSFRIIRVIRKGTKVTVLREENGWLRIKCPEGTNAWVHNKYVKTGSKGSGIITGNRVNVRAVPSINGIVLTQLSKGTKVKVKGKKGEWIKIEAPPTASAWVFGKYVDFVVSQKEQKVLSEIRKLRKRLESQLASETKKDPIDWNVGALEAGYTKLLKLASKGKDIESKNAARLAKARLEQLRSVKELQKKLKTAAKKSKEIEKEYQQKLAKLKQQPPKYTAKGWIDDVGPVIGRPGTHRLTTGGKTLYYLRSKRFNLYDYVGCYVGVNGKVLPSPQGWDAPVIEVEKIDTLHAAEKGIFQ